MSHLDLFVNEALQERCVLINVVCSTGSSDVGIVEVRQQRC